MQNTNRLNFSNMVGRQLNSSNRGRQADVYFQPLYTAPRNRAHKRVMPKTKIDTSLKSIINTVHTTMKDKSISPPKSTAPSIPQPIKEIDKANFTKVKNKKNVIISRHLLPTANRSIPQTKANWEQKNHQRMRRGIGNGMNTNNFGYQQRVKEVLRQKRILEDMLNEHQRLQRDRVSIAVEIQAMKTYLNDIRDKLDFSLRKLSAKKPISAAKPTPTKARQPPARSVSRSGNANKKALAPAPAQVRNSLSVSPKRVEVKKKHKV